MKNKFGILIFWVFMLTAGCKTTATLTDMASPTIMLRIRGTGNMHSQVMETIHKVKYIQGIRVINENGFLDHFQQMEIAIDLGDAKQWSVLQRELLRIPGIMAVTVL